MKIYEYYNLKCVLKDVLDNTDLDGGVRDRFFRRELSTRVASSAIDPACHGKTTFIPRRARARNLAGKWKYLVQDRGSEVQHFEV